MSRMASRPHRTPSSLPRASLRAALVVGAFAIPLALLAAAPSGCGSVTVSPDGGEGGGTTSTPPEPEVTILHPDADPLPGETECVVTITTGIPVASATHVEACSHVDYTTNPPSGGDHWGIWTAYQTYAYPVPREMYVHNMEHGSVILLSRCSTDCPEVDALLEEARESVSGDPKCLMIPDGPTERVVITPDPLLDTPIAAAAWGATYTATCLDPSSLKDFAKKHYDKGTESTCAQGKVFGVPGSGAPECNGAGGNGGGSSGGAGGSGGTGGTGGTGAGASGVGGSDAG
ncbi:MAG: DUF3105 domain-containing protein [Polyangiaceae bacterium]